MLAAAAAAQTPPLPGSAAALNAESKNISNSNAEKSAEIARHALVLAREAGDAINAAEALHNLAAAQRNLGRYDLARDFAQQSADAYAAAGDRKGEAQGYNTLGLIDSDRGDYPRALEHHHKALAIRRQAGAGVLVQQPRQPRRPRFVAAARDLHHRPVRRRLHARVLSGVRGRGDRAERGSLNWRSTNGDRWIVDDVRTADRMIRRSRTQSAVGESPNRQQSPDLQSPITQ